MNSKTFAELGLCEPVLQALRDEKYVTPTPIQDAAIPALLEGRDMLGCAQTGTGKTAAFALPILHAIEQRRRAAVPNRPSVLVLSPTRELADQISESFVTYGRHVRFRQAAVFGGVGQAPQVRALRRGVHVLTATPGRLMDLMEQGHVELDRLEVFVLDEADRMLDMGFLPAIRRIVASLPERRQSLMFSATMPAAAGELAATLLRDPLKVAITSDYSAADSIEQLVMYLDNSEKRPALERLLQDERLEQVIVFTRTKRRAEIVADQIRESGVRADAIHGDKSQAARQRALKGFRMGRTRVLVATDVAARGLDVDGISHVINYDLPHEPESYVHRIGRTGRAGACGTAISFCDGQEESMLRDIERLLSRELPKEGQPSRRSSSGPRVPQHRRKQHSAPAAGRKRRRPPRKVGAAR